MNALLAVAVLGFVGGINAQWGNNNNGNNGNDWGAFDPSSFFGGNFPSGLWSNLPNNNNNNNWAIPAVPSTNNNWWNPSPAVNSGSNDQASVPAVQQNIPLQTNFQPASYQGLWYEIYRTKNMPWEFGTDDIANYTLNADGSIAVLNREWLPSFNRWSVATAVAKPVGTDPAHLSVKFTMFGPSAPAGDYRILATDYNQFSVVYSFNENAPKNPYAPQQQQSGPVKMGWLLSRTPILPQNFVDYAFQLYGQQGLTMADFNKTVHGVAPYPAPAA